MGNKKSRLEHKSKPEQKQNHSFRQFGNKPPKDYSFIGDHFDSYKELEEGLRKAGLESSQLIVGVDFTKSNTWNGGPPYYVDANLHSITPYPNPYQQVLEIMCRTLEPFDDDHLIPAYGFGDARTTDKSIFSFGSTLTGEEAPCYQLYGVLEAYNKIVSDIDNGYLRMSGPTTFAPLIRRAIDIVRKEKCYHILLIICDGEISNISETIDAIVAASKYPLSIVCVGVGKGPWETMEKFDDDIPERDFDNFQFVDFHKIMRQCENKEAEFAKHALMEIPEQYEYIKHHIL
jgi:E3 ubiquitin-protein ligase RGLG